MLLFLRINKVWGHWPWQCTVWEEEDAPGLDATACLPSTPSPPGIMNSSNNSLYSYYNQRYKDSWGFKEWSNLIFFPCSYPVFPVPFVEETVFPTWYSCLLWYRVINHRCMGLFLGFVSCSIDLYFCFVPVLYCFDDCSFALFSGYTPI